MESLNKLQIKANAGIEEAFNEIKNRTENMIELPLKGIHDEKIKLTGLDRLNVKVKEIKKLYLNVPEEKQFIENVLLDAHSSATIEGARTTVERMKKCLDKPISKDEKMVANTYKACMKAYEQKVDADNIRQIWEIIVDGVCENIDKKGKFYRDGMVYIGSENEIIHQPAPVDKITKYMDDLFDFEKTNKIDSIIKSFIFHFYFIYIHPFCDGNGRIVRTINNSQLFFDGYKKIKSISLATAINTNLSGYYRTIAESEQQVSIDEKGKFLDIAPFVDYMLDMLELAMINAKLAANSLSSTEKKLLEKMNKVGKNAEITVKKATKICGLTESGCRKVLNSLAEKGYLEIDSSEKRYRYRLITR